MMDRSRWRIFLPKTEEEALARRCKKNKEGKYRRASKIEINEN
jgi:hypothetical protein